ncbi:hypothetical protein [Poseidonibacter ostreae]|jgi:translation elongation factor EF-1beta|uniref:Uncharacterized protein n=1 Tax=Poseidonibacter ostreae TaxID=2654171 RepID=A0A6L4WND6_9BACT|nr:hypothetical protein [Poseidonibacter ostreae]KAB7884931.1 hypothetical protein GBG19_15075 [Poseidonibacter ostreae]MAC82722.1 hypothetical protein [Arcobacter sp.]|tara:strand:- start:1223 stop:1537 length:315 start_codon:yes stop_codon:yes gene_type:complete
MYDYLKILQEKAKKIDVDIKVCGYDKECIMNELACKVRSNLENEELSVIKEKAIKIHAVINTNNMDKNSLLDVIEERIKEILEEENERYTSIEMQQNFMPLDLG